MECVLVLGTENPLLQFRRTQILSRLPLEKDIQLILSSYIQTCLSNYTASPLYQSPNMITTKLALFLLGLFTTSTIADFAIGGYSGEQLAGT